MESVFRLGLRTREALRDASLAGKSLVAEFVVLILWMFPVWHLRFTWTEANRALIWILAAAVVATATLTLRKRFSKIIRYGFYCIAVFLLFVMAPFVILSGLTLFGSISGYEKIAEVSSGISHYRAYRGSCGAVCSFSIEIRREIDLLPGLHLVSTIYEREPAERASMFLTDPGTIRAEIKYGDSALEEFEILP